MPSFTCATCAKEFAVPQAALDKYPGWTPRACRECKDAAAAAKGDVPAGRARKRLSVTATEILTPEEVLARYHGGPQDGIFTDGGANPNPGPGGWGVVWVRGGEIVAERHGGEPHSTNNRMELTALIEAFGLAPPDEPVRIYTDSELCVNIVTRWAADWERAGWKRKTGPIKNLDLVQRLVAAAKTRPLSRVEWVPAHSGGRWNEYADALASLR